MDDGSPIRYLLLLIVCIVGSAFFSAVETAFASVNKIRMKSLAEDGDKSARRVLKIMDHFERALTTLLICNNITNIGSATLATVFAIKYWGTDSVVAATAVLTVVVFLFAEVMPKSYAKTCSEQFALATAGFVSVLVWLLTPLAFIFTGVGKFLSLPFKKNHDEPTVTEEELYDIIDTIVEEGAMDEDTGELVQSALEFSHRTAYEVMTPWNGVLKIKTDMRSAQILELIKENAHSRYPVIDAQNNPIGIIQIRKYLKKYMLSDGRVRLRDVMDKVHYVKGDVPVDELLPKMSANKTHVALVQRGSGVAGIITVEDILEELVGEIYDEDDIEGGALNDATN